MFNVIVHFHFDTYDKIIKNGYPCEKIIMGMESGQFTKETFSNALEEVSKINENPTMGGVYDWEYLDAPPEAHNPSIWCKLMKQTDTIYWDLLG